MKIPKYGLLTALLTAVLLLSLTVSSSAQADKYSGFRRRSQLLADTQDSILATDSTKKVKLDRQKASRKKIVSEDVAFLQELADFSNDVAEASKAPQGIDGASSKLNKYPRVQTYFSQAKAFESSGQTLSLHRQGSTNPLTNFAVIGSPISEAAGMSDCGAFWNPKPSVAKDAVYRNVSNASATLKSWGYHESRINGAFWTRPQTWHPWNCGWNTFRDNAAPVSATRLWEQNYSGWNPRGEPNPEIYASGPWPYSTWPAYVYWWHATH